VPDERRELPRERLSPRSSASRARARPVCFYRERQFLVTRAGIPEALLPDHRELGRMDLRF